MNASRKEEEGHQLMTEADKMDATKSSFFKSLFSSGTNKEEVAETYVRAANAFKLAKSWTNAGRAFERAAEVYSQVTDLQYDAASKYADAAKAYKNVNPASAIPSFEKSIQMYADAGRFQQCARLQKDVAEIYEAEDGDIEKALEAYSSAADFYDMDDAKSNANSMRIKVAALKGLAGQYKDAIELFEQIAESSLTNNLLKYGAREHLLRAGLCHLCQADVIGAQRALDKYANMDSSFPPSREGRLLTEVVAAVSDSDEKAFTNHVYEYDSVGKLDEWKTGILLKIKQQIKAEAEDEDLT